MCGLAGVVSPASFQETSAFVDLLKISALRGPHSTGLMIARRFVTQIYKEAVDSMAFTESLEMSKVLNPLDMHGDVYMAHCRYATIGTVNRRNAHPFRNGSLVLAHNGTIHSLAGDKHHQGTDSENLLSKISEVGMIPALGELEPKDAFAISLYDSKNKILHLARNALRPLAFGVIQDSGTFFYASEPAMLRFVFARNGLDGKVYSVAPWKVFSIDPAQIRFNNLAPWWIEGIPHVVEEKKVENELPKDSSAAL